MSDPTLATLLLAFLVAMIFLGVQIATALGIASIVGVTVITGDHRIALSLLHSTAYEALRDYVFAVVPLFILMGELIGKSGAASDLFNSVNRLLHRLPNRLSLAVVVGNAIFAFVTGVSVAAAAAFSRVAYPQMKDHGYRTGPALGVIAGTACLGMLIPPSVLLIVWGVITEASIGKLFLAGVLPGLLIAGLFFIYNIGIGVFAPGLVMDVDRHDTMRERDETTAPPLQSVLSALGLASIIVACLGGIWMGFFTPTEGAGVGVILALILAVGKGVGFSGLVQAVLHTAKTSAPILILLIMAQLYSRMLALAGVVPLIQDLFAVLDASPWIIVSIMVLIWLIMGMFIDSVSIILLTLPIFFPVAYAAGVDPLVFAIVGILAIEAGLMTPPFGILVYSVRAAVDDDVTLREIFVHVTPYWVLLITGVLLIALFPQLVTYLPSLI